MASVERWVYRVACLFSELRPKTKGEQSIGVDNLGDRRLLTVTDNETGVELARGEGETYQQALDDMRRRLS